MSPALGRLALTALLIVATGCGDTSNGDPSGDASMTPDASSIPDAGTIADGASPDASSTTYWRIERPADSARTWLVSPAGERTFVLGVNTVMRDTACDGIGDYIRRMEPTRAAHRSWARLSSGESGGEQVSNPYCFNSVGAFSETNDFDETGGDSHLVRAPEDGGAGAPYAVVLNPTARGDDRALKDEHGTVLRPGYSGYRVGDPWNPAYLADLEQMVTDDVLPRVEDPRLQMWFLGNETGIFDRTSRDAEGVRDFRRHLWSDCPAGSTPSAPLCVPHALAAFLDAEYGGDLSALNTAWESQYPGSDFAVIVEVGPRPVPYVHDCNLTCRYDLQQFVHDRLLAEWVRVVTVTVRATDPNHLLSSPRLALSTSTNYRFWAPASGSNPDVWADEPTFPVPTDTAEATFCPFDLLARQGDAGFDLISVNVYEGDETFEEPWFSDGIQKLQDRSGLPVLISEFSVRARIDGWSNRGGAWSFVPATDGIDDQVQRGERYQTQLAQFLANPGIVGACWHAWSDRYLAADEDRQINLGLMQCDDPVRGFVAGERWDPLDDHIAQTNCNIESLIESSTGL